MREYNYRYFDSFSDGKPEGIVTGVGDGINYGIFYLFMVVNA